MDTKTTESFKQSLMPLYDELTKKVYSQYFCVQWGKNYPTENHDGILFVGRATNGWVSNTNDVNLLFGEPDATNTIFNRKDQLEWKENSPKGHKSNYSPFWQFVKNVTQQHFKCKNGWTSHIAWSNLYKVSPIGEGNPNEQMKKEQLDVCKQILKMEIEILSPKFVVIPTGEDWYSKFIKYLNNNTEPTFPDIKIIKEHRKKKDIEHKCCTCNINNITYILTDYPMRGDQNEMVNYVIQKMR